LNGSRSNVDAAEAVELSDFHRHEQAGIQVCLIMDGGELYALDLGRVREVFEVQSVTKVPRVPSAIIGVTNLRGTVIGLVEVGTLTGSSRTSAPRPYAVVVRYGNKHAGILIERVPEIRTVPQEQWIASEEKKGYTPAQRLVAATLQIEDQIARILDVQALFELVEIGPVSSADDVTR
jgi:purine-binding chemotaxis protein CheW